MPLSPPPPPLPYNQGVPMLVSSVASFLVWGGGGKPPKCIDRKKIHIHVTYYARASEASERLRNIIFSGIKILTAAYTYIINAIPFYYIWYGAINDSIPTKH